MSPRVEASQLDRPLPGFLTEFLFVWFFFYNRSYLFLEALGTSVVLYRVLPSFTEVRFYWVLLGFYLVLLGFI